jgi:hypothetical protein
MLRKAPLVKTTAQPQKLHFWLCRQLKLSNFHFSWFLHHNRYGWFTLWGVRLFLVFRQLFVDYVWPWTHNNTWNYIHDCVVDTFNFLFFTGLFICTLFVTQIFLSDSCCNTSGVDLPCLATVRKCLFFSNHRRTFVNTAVVEFLEMFALCIRTLVWQLKIKML